MAANACGVDAAVLAVASRTRSGELHGSQQLAALSRSIAVAITNGGGGPTNQAGLVNVNLSQLAQAVPVSVAVPIGIAANVCG